MLELRPGSEWQAQADVCRHRANGPDQARANPNAAVFRKVHGVAAGTFEVRRHLPSNLRVGVFALRNCRPGSDSPAISRRPTPIFRAHAAWGSSSSMSRARSCWAPGGLKHPYCESVIDVGQELSRLLSDDPKFVTRYFTIEARQRRIQRLTTGSAPSIAELIRRLEPQLCS
ncbi:MAG: hypothetical protein QOK24_2772 [Verrucomicrobiota bacterium]|jgi:hypothetical protein